MPKSIRPFYYFIFNFHKLHTYYNSFANKCRKPDFECIWYAHQASYLVSGVPWPLVRMVSLASRIRLYLAMASRWTVRSAEKTSPYWTLEGSVTDPSSTLQARVWGRESRALQPGRGHSLLGNRSPKSLLIPLYVLVLRARRRED